MQMIQHVEGEKSWNLAEEKTMSMTMTTFSWIFCILRMYQDSPRYKWDDYVNFHAVSLSFGGFS